MNFFSKILKFCKNFYYFIINKPKIAFLFDLKHNFVIFLFYNKGKNMTEFLHNLFATVFNDNVILATILIAMLPVIELRGAIPFATNSGFWGNLAMSQWTAFGWSLLGSSAIVPIIALIFLPLINWLKRTKLFGRLATAIENRVKNKTNSIENAEEKSKIFSKSYWKKMLAVFIFVAVPLPFTGVWTGTCVAVFIGLDYLSTCFSVIGGNIIAGLLITLILEFFPWLNDWLFYFFLILIALIILYEVITYFIKKRKAQKDVQE